MTKFDVYANVRRIRQAVGDMVDANFDREWDDVFGILNSLECKLERMDLSEGDAQ